MTTQTIIDVHTSESQTPAEPVATRRAAVVIALLFLGATATFLTGDALVLQALDGPVVDTDGLLLGVALQTLNAMAVVGLGVAFLNVLPIGVRRLALGHLALRIAEAVTVIGLGGWMMATESLVDYEPVIYLFTGSAGLLLTAALARTQLVERSLVRLGVVGYVAILSALPLQLLTSASLDSFPGLLLYVPGALFELVLPLLLLVRGFRGTAGPAAGTPDTTEPRRRLARHRTTQRMNDMHTNETDNRPNTGTPPAATMSALIQARFGDPHEVLRVDQVERPQLPDDGVLVRVRAASVHVGTVYGVRGLPKVMRPMFKKFIAENGVIGLCMAGIAEAVGPEVTGVTVGDEVVGWASGAFAEYAATTSEALVPKPTNLTFEQAATLGVSAFTALQALRDHGNLHPGQHVLVTGASGGVGTFAVQIAKAMGAKVTGVCSTRNLDLVRSIGADHVIDYTQQNWTTGGPTYDLVLDNVGGHSLRDMRRVLTADGLLLANGAPAPTGWFGGIGHPLRVLASSLFSRRQARPFLATEKTEDLRTLRDMAETGRIAPVVDRVFPLEDAVDAVATVGAGHNRGTSVIAT